MRAQDTQNIDASMRPARPGPVRSTAAAVVLALGMLAPLTGCLSAQRGGITIAPDAGPAASQPARSSPHIDADQLVGGIAAKIAPYIESAIHLAVSTTIAPVLNATATASMENRLEAKLTAKIQATANVASGNTTYYPWTVAAVEGVGALSVIIALSLALKRATAHSDLLATLYSQSAERSHGREMARISAAAPRESPSGIDLRSP